MNGASILPPAFTWDCPAMPPLTNTEPLTEITVPLPGGFPHHPGPECAYRANIAHNQNHSLADMAPISRSPAMVLRSVICKTDSSQVNAPSLPARAVFPLTITEFPTLNSRFLPGRGYNLAHYVAPKPPGWRVSRQSHHLRGPG